MKKVISMFLLLLVLTIGAHPVLAMHFCGGKLHSFDMLGSKTENSCCGKNEASKLEVQSANSEITQHAQTHETQLSHEDCCKTQTVELSTSDYQHQIQHFNLSNILPSFDNVWLVLYSLLSLESENTTTETQYNFSPGGFRLHNADLLTYICISRI